MAATTESTTVETLSEEEARETGLRLCRSYLRHRGFVLADDADTSDGGPIVAVDDGEAVLVTVSVDMGSEALPTLDVDSTLARSMRRECLCWLLDHEGESAVRHDVVAIAITGRRRARIRHLVGVCRWSED